MHSNREKKFEDIFNLTKILVHPRHNLATFGISNIKYYFLASLDIRKTRLREGAISFEKPKIILPTELKEVFEGYGPETEEFINEIYSGFGSELRVLGYHFKHLPGKSKTLLEPFAGVLKKIKDESGAHNIQRCLPEWI